MSDRRKEGGSIEGKGEGKCRRGICAVLSGRQSIHPDGDRGTRGETASESDRERERESNGGNTRRTTRARNAGAAVSCVNAYIPHILVSTAATTAAANECMMVLNVYLFVLMPAVAQTLVGAEICQLLGDSR